jgi:hypothetical protein
MRDCIFIDRAARLLANQVLEQVERLRQQREAGELSDEDFAKAYEAARRITQGLLKAGENPLPPMPPL